MNKFIDKATCTGCGKEKYLYQFSPRRISKNGKTGRCKDCINHYQKVFRARKKGPVNCYTTWRD